MTYNDLGDAILDKLLTYHDNYDAVVKDAFAAYKDKSLEFLGIKGKVEELLSAENIEVEIRKTYNDFPVKLDSGDGVTIEMEADISHKDLLRFCAYSIGLTRKFNIPFETVIITKKEPRHKSYISRSLKFTPRIINLTKRSSKTTLAKIKRNLAAGKDINQLEIVFLPLYNHPEMTYEDIYKAIIEILPSVAPDKHEQDRLLALSVLIANKFISEDEYKKILGAIRMSFDDFKIFKILKEEGEEEGRLEKAKEIAKGLFECGVSIDIIKKTTGLSDDVLLEIQDSLALVVQIAK